MLPGISLSARDCITKRIVMSLPGALALKVPASSRSSNQMVTRPMIPLHSAYPQRSAADIRFRATNSDTVLLEVEYLFLLDWVAECRAPLLEGHRLLSQRGEGISHDQGLVASKSVGAPVHVIGAGFQGNILCKARIQSVFSPGISDQRHFPNGI